MSYNIASLTPSRPAPPVPGAGSSRLMQQSRSTSQSSARSNPNFSSSSYASSFPILKPTSALNTAALAHEGRKTVIRTGHANVKEEGLRSFMWPRKWLVLGGTDLQIFKNEVSPFSRQLRHDSSLTMTFHQTRITQITSTLASRHVTHTYSKLHHQYTYVTSPR